MRFFLDYIVARYEFLLVFEDGYIVIRLRRRPQATGFKVLVNNKEIEFMQIPSGQKVTATLSVEPTGATVDPNSKIDWISDGDVTIIPSSDGMSASLQNPATSKPGKQTVTVTGDADLGAGVKNITKTFEIETLAAGATGFAVTFGSVQDI